MWEIKCSNCERVFIHDEIDDIQCPICDYYMSLKKDICNDCNDCNGSGEGFYQEQKCLKCKGMGVLRNEQSN